MKSTHLLYLVIFLISLFFVVGVFAYNDLNSKVVGIYNNAGFSSTVDEIDDSVFMIVVQPLQDSIQPFTSAIYVDEFGEIWAKGTGFSVTEKGDIVTAFHLFGDVNFSNKKIEIILKGGEKRRIGVERYFVNTDLDLIVIKTNLSIKPVRLAKNVQVPAGSKIGFIGYPSTSDQIVSDGIISGSREVTSNNEKFFIYTINSFVNAGNSGGPVFLADSGEVIGIINAKELARLDVPNVDAVNLSTETKFILQYQNYLFSQLQRSGQTGIGYSVGVNEYVFNVTGKN